jgi:hypothetical protein
MISEDLVFFKENIKDSYLVGFGNTAQFIYLEFNNSQYEEIKFYLDCNITINDNQIEELVKPFKLFSEDIYMLAYFIVLNNKKVVKCYYDEKSLWLVFENSMEIKFRFDKPDSDIGVSFKESYHDMEYIVVDINAYSLSRINGT